VRSSFNLTASASTAAIAVGLPRRSAMNLAADCETPKSAGSSISPAKPSANAHSPYSSGPSARTRNTVTTAVNTAVVAWEASANAALRRIESPGCPPRLLSTPHGHFTRRGHRGRAAT
jgi:hypothetical protein